MTMHLVGPYMTTTRYNNSKKKSKKTQSQIQAEQAHEKYLRKESLFYRDHGGDMLFKHLWSKQWSQ